MTGWSAARGELPGYIRDNHATLTCLICMCPPVTVDTTVTIHVLCTHARTLWTGDTRAPPRVGRQTRKPPRRCLKVLIVPGGSTSALASFVFDRSSTGRGVTSDQTRTRKVKVDIEVISTAALYSDRHSSCTYITPPGSSPGGTNARSINRIQVKTSRSSAKYQQTGECALGDPPKRITIPTRCSLQPTGLNISRRRETKQWVRSRSSVSAHIF
jgi:hypothetical protein